MAMNFVEHEIRDNTVVTNKLPSSTNKITTLLGVRKVVVGVADTTKTAIRTNSQGIKYETNAVDAQQIYNLSTQCRGNWFALDLETGRADGKSWYPGSKQIATTIGSATEIKEEMSDTSATLITVNEANVDIEYNEKDSAGVTWYKVKYVTTEGYVKSGSLTNFRYVDREE